MRPVWRLAAPLAFALAGLLFATSAGAARGGDLRGGSRSDLADLIRAEEQRADEVTSRVDRLRAEVQAATEEAGRTDRRVAAEQDRSRGLELAAGTTPVVGPGLTVTLADAPRSADRVLPPEASPDDLVVHQQDVQAVVNALWDGGAEAMQIMDQRVITTSAVRCVGNTLILQGRVYSPAVRHHRDRRPRAAAADAGRLRRGLALPLLRRHLRAGLPDQGPDPGPAARLRRVAGPAARRAPAVSRGGDLPRAAVRGLGELLITAGLLLLLFVAYQLVWTNLEAQRAQSKVADQLREQWQRPPAGGTGGDDRLGETGRG